MDSGNILSIMLTASGGTLMSDNAVQCIAAPSVTWAQRNDSLISYNVSQVCCVMCVCECKLACASHRCYH